MFSIISKFFSKLFPWKQKRKPPTNSLPPDGTMIQSHNPGGVDSLDLAHFVMYGQSGASTEHRVLPTAWKTKPFTRSVITTPWSVSIAPPQLTALINGFKPREMEDKWFVCSEGEVKEGETVNLNFYRSWTGRKISTMEILVGKEGEGGRVSGLVWEGNRDVVKEQDSGGAKDVVREVCRWVLGADLGADE
jgi:hypothetical protein